MFRGLVGSLTTEKGLTFRGNLVDREPVYTKMDGQEAPCNSFGAITLHSVSADAQDVLLLPSLLTRRLAYN